VERLLAADAIVIGRQTCDEFAMGSTNEHAAYGPARNPVDPSRVPGGSSGASAAAVAAGCCLVSLGSDTGGSVRQPASFCGVVGLKPTYSRISRHGLIAYASSFDIIGVLAHNADDAALVLQTIAGPDDFDATVSQQPVPPYAARLQEPLPPCRIGYIAETLESEGLSEPVRQAAWEAIERLRQAGHEVVPVAFDLLDYVLPTYYILTAAEASTNLSRFDGVRYGHRTNAPADLEALYKQTRSEGFGREVQRRIMLGTFVLSASYYDAYFTKAQRVRRLIKERTEAMLQEVDFLFSPTAPTVAMELGKFGEANVLEMYLADLFTVQASVAGIPAISVPAGHDDAGLPIGMQFMARPFDEARLLQLAKSFR
jgi:aspartyl-tRNA(Asn)/glutamyl-tRNA(Gln) amidotransferase subunit A